MDDIYQDFWSAFLEQTGAPENTILTGWTYFGNSEEASVAALGQLRRGEKTAVGHCIPAYIAARQRMPRVGDYTLVTDFYGNPGCILLTRDVVIDPLPAIPPALRQKERPELTPEQWLEEKQREFRALAEQQGFHYHAELPILLELVKMVYPNG